MTEYYLEYKNDDCVYFKRKPAPESQGIENDKGIEPKCLGIEEFLKMLESEDVVYGIDNSPILANNINSIQIAINNLPEFEG